MTGYWPPNHNITNQFDTLTFYIEMSNISMRFLDLFRPKKFTTSVVNTPSNEWSRTVFFIPNVETLLSEARTQVLNLTGVYIPYTIVSGNATIPLFVDTTYECVHIFGQILNIAYYDYLVVMMFNIFSQLTEEPRFTVTLPYIAKPTIIPSWFIPVSEYNSESPRFPVIREYSEFAWTTSIKDASALPGTMTPWIRRHNPSYVIYLHDGMTICKGTVESAEAIEELADILKGLNQDITINTNPVIVKLMGTLPSSRWD